MTVQVDSKKLIWDWDSGLCLRSLASKYGMSAATAKTVLNSAGVNTSKRSCLSKEALEIITSTNSIFDEFKTQRLSVRQVYYQLNKRQVLPLSNEGYKAAVKALTKGRKGEYIPWNRIEDRTRKPHTPAMWKGVDDFLYSVLNAYRRDLWINQPSRFEIWLEKNALYGVVAPIAHKYGITLQVITGYSSISAIYDGAQRLRDGDTILYLGDHDATGVDIDRSLRDSFIEDHGLNINVKRIALLYDDIDAYNLPPNFEKEADTRLKGYREKGYTKQAELDALPPNILVDRIEAAILSHLDIKAYREYRKIQKQELNEIRSRFGGV